MSDPQLSTPKPGWYPVDPAQPSLLGYWDGSAWTSHRQRVDTAVVTASTPVVEPPEKRSRQRRRPRKTARTRIAPPKRPWLIPTALGLLIVGGIGVGWGASTLDTIETAAEGGRPAAGEVWGTGTVESTRYESHPVWLGDRFKDETVCTWGEVSVIVDGKTVTFNPGADQIIEVATQAECDAHVGETVRVLYDPADAKETLRVSTWSADQEHQTVMLAWVAGGAGATALLAGLALSVWAIIRGIASVRARPRISKSEHSSESSPNLGECDDAELD